MELQSACCRLHAPNIRLSSNQRSLSSQTVSPSFSVCSETSRSHVGFKDRRLWLQNAYKFNLLGGLKRTRRDSSGWSFSKGGIVLNFSGKDVTKLRVNGVDEPEPFRGKSGSVSFHGLTHQLYWLLSLDFGSCCVDFVVGASTVFSYRSNRCLCQG
ncbi:hypothetical protein CsSME_00035958 [Camellia sinensis var. sinensis]